MKRDGIIHVPLPPIGTPGDWSHIIKQIGMFTFTGLNKDQVAFMTKEYHLKHHNNNNH